MYYKFITYLNNDDTSYTASYNNTRGNSNVNGFIIIKKIIKTKLLSSTGNNEEFT